MARLIAEPAPPARARRRRGQAFGHAVNSAVSGAVALIGFATVAAWLIERQGVKIAYLDRWRVRDLKMLEVAAA